MSRWFRHYAGMCRDEKLVRVALRSKQTIERVVWIYAAILESASEIDNGGQFEVDVPEIAYFLRADEADVQGVIDALEAMGRLAEGGVAKWGDRQFQSDRSAERQRLHREKKRARDGEVLPEPGPEVGAQTVTPASCNGGVTSLSRHGDAPETETETNTEEKKDTSETSSDLLAEEKSSKPKKARADYPQPFVLFWGDYPTDPLMSKKDALTAWNRLDLPDRDMAMRGIPALKEHQRKNPTYRMVHACRYLSQRRFEGLAAPADSTPATPIFETTEDWFANLRARRSAAGAN